MRPSLTLNFAKTKLLDQRISFSRASTATYFDERGVLKIVPSNTARFDHDPTTGRSKGLLLEDAATNILWPSIPDDVGTSYWVNGSALTVTNNAAMAPDGTLTATKFVGLTGESNSSGGASLRVRDMPSFAAGTYTFSFYAYSTVAGVPFNIRFIDSGISLDTTVACSSENSDGLLATRWKRFHASITLGATSNGLTIITSLTNSNDIYIWGGQLETGSFPTSYIPTTGAAVTRAADSASMSGNNFTSWYRQSEGTFVIDYTLGYKLAGIRCLSVSDGTSNNYIEVVGGSGSPPSVDSGPYLYGTVGGVAGEISANNAIANVASSRRVFAGAYKVNDFASTTAGKVPTTDVDGVLPAVDRLQFSNSLGQSTSLLNGHIGRFVYYPVRLSNLTLQELSQ
jgi:hypothetical protein